tara:strand:+ start:845 stop:2407 length:1563 start_codon:yes stop_codon:yes gene_type:complete
MRYEWAVASKQTNHRNARVPARLVQALLCFCFLVFLVRPINLMSADLGRHLVNGRIGVEQHQIHTTNTYSYTHPEYPMPNHHWASGVVFYLVHHAFGFNGLSVFYATASVAAFLIMFGIALRTAGLPVAAVAAAALMPLLTHRYEIRPEVFTYLFAAVSFWILWSVREKRLASGWLWALPVIQVLWVNLHIYFVLGIGLVGAFFCEAVLFRWLGKDSGEQRRYALLLAGVVVASLINPFGVAALVYPFSDFQHARIPVIENMSIPGIAAFGLHYSNIATFKVMAAIFILSWVLLLLARPTRAALPLFLISVVFTAAAWQHVRNFTLFAVFALPIFAINLRSILPPTWARQGRPTHIVCIVAFLVVAGAHGESLKNRWRQRGAGLFPGQEKAAAFFKEQELKGPIFNNYDLGGYLIYYLYPEEPVFIDNRMEAYPVAFFHDEYIPMLAHEERWNERSEKYGFNVVFFGTTERSPAAQSFVRGIVQHPDWASVYADSFTVILVRRTPEHAELIREHEIGRDR